MAPQAGVASHDGLARQLEARGVELNEDTRAVVQEQARRHVAAEGAAVAGVRQIEVAVVVHVGEVAVAREVDERARDQLRRRDRGARSAQTGPARGRLIRVEAQRATLGAAHVGPPLVALVGQLRGVRHVDVVVAVAVKVDEFDVAALVEHRGETRRGDIREDADRAGLQEALVEPQVVLVVAVVAAFGQRGVPVAVEVDVGEVHVFRETRVVRDVRGVARQLLRGSRSSQGQKAEEGSAALPDLKVACHEGCRNARR